MKRYDELSHESIELSTYLIHTEYINMIRKHSEYGV